MQKIIILIRPEITMINYRSVNPPLGLGYLASYLMKNGFKVFILDLALYKITLETLSKFISHKQPILIGITALTSYYSEMKKLSLFLKEKFPGIPIVLGGVHVSSLPMESIKECNADFVVVGEGEQTLLELANAISRKSSDFSTIKGIYYKKDDKIVVNEPRGYIKDLDSLPMPAWHMISPLKYVGEPHGFIVKSIRVAPMFTSRGCPFSCSYCASCQFWGQRIRFRSPKNVVDEIEYLVKTFKVKEIHAWDDNITLNRKHIEGICKEIIKRGLRIHLATPNGVRVDTLDERMMKLMRAAGFYKMTFAVESASYRVLRDAGKNSDLKKIVKNTIIAKKLGFYLNSYFILGFPTDTESTINKTIRFAKSLPFDFATFFIMKPLPGSRLFREWAG
ncbi:MAG: B12-binding domain-containing radical SAM protein, partial [Promethearchaeota archaeon]